MLFIHNCVLSVFISGEYDRIIKHRERYERRMNSLYRKHSNEQSDSSHDRTKRSISIEKHVETLVVVDTEMVNYYQNEDIETYVLTIMNMVSICFYLFITKVTSL